MTRNSRERSARAARQGLAVAFAAMLSLAQLGSVAHQFSADHRTCEHGQLVEVEDASARLTHEDGEAEVAHLIASDEERAETTHVHCLAAALLRQAASCPRSARTQRPAAPLASARPAVRTGSTVPRAVLLLLAPKASPPA